MDEELEDIINMKGFHGWRRLWLRAKKVRFLVALGSHLLLYPIPSLLFSLYHLMALLFLGPLPLPYLFLLIHRYAKSFSPEIKAALRKALTQ